MEDKKEEKALRFNEGKVQWSLMHYESMEPMIRVLEFGCKKYSRDNWKKPMDTKKILESMQRHLAALMDGQEIDPETGISHIGNIMCNSMFYSYHSTVRENEEHSLSPAEQCFRDEIPDTPDGKLPFAVFRELCLFDVDSKFWVDNNHMKRSYEYYCQDIQNCKLPTGIKEAELKLKIIK